MTHNKAHEWTAQVKGEHLHQAHREAVLSGAADRRAGSPIELN